MVPYFLLNCRFDISVIMRVFNNILITHTVDHLMIVTMMFTREMNVIVEIIQFKKSIFSVRMTMVVFFLFMPMPMTVSVTMSVSVIFFPLFLLGQHLPMCINIFVIFLRHRLILFLSKRQPSCLLVEGFLVGCHWSFILLLKERNTYLFHLLLLMLLVHIDIEKGFVALSMGF